MHKQNRRPCTEIDSLTEYNQEFKDAVKPYLLNNSENHCSYCDAYFEDVDNLVIEHFKEKTNYPELKTEYSNLYAACNACNNHKKYYKNLEKNHYVLIIKIMIFINIFISTLKQEK